MNWKEWYKYGQAPCTETAIGMVRAICNLLPYKPKESEVK